MLNIISNKKNENMTPLLKGLAKTKNSQMLTSILNNGKKLS